MIPSPALPPLVCPLCHSTKLTRENLTCLPCGKTYSDAEGYLNLTPLPPPHGEVLEKWDLWEKLQANGVASYEDAPIENLSVGHRADAQAFGNYCGLEGHLILDVGCGPQELPSYALGHESRFVGIDPLRGQQKRGFFFVQGIAEYLPFPNESFDRVLFGTSLDHFISPHLALREARRILKANGVLGIWYGVVGAEDAGDAVQGFVPKLLHKLREDGLGAVLKRAIRRLGLGKRSITEKLTIPEGAIDHFHFFHVETEHLHRWLKDAGFEVRGEQRNGNSVYLLATPAAV